MEHARRGLLGGGLVPEGEGRGEGEGKTRAQIRGAEEEAEEVHIFLPPITTAQQSNTLRPPHGASPQRAASTARSRACANVPVRKAVCDKHRQLLDATIPVVVGKCYTVI